MPDQVTTFLELGKNLGGIFLVVFYGAIVLWTYKDARRRIDDPILIATAVATSMLPIVGVLVYMMLRPPEYLADVRERELEIRAMERTLGRQERCPYCKSHIEGTFLSCPVCMTKLRHECTGCDKPLDPRWVMCPYCETEVPHAGREAHVPSKPSRSKPKVATTRSGGRSSSSSKSTKTSKTSKAPRTVDTPKKSSSSKSADIETEPFGSGNRRFVRDSSTSSIDQPTMVGPGSPDSTL